MDKYDVYDLIRDGKTFAILSSGFDKYDLYEFTDRSKAHNNCLMIIDNGNLDKYEIMDLLERGGRVQPNTEWDKHDVKKFIESANRGNGLVILQISNDSKWII